MFPIKVNPLRIAHLDELQKLDKKSEEKNDKIEQCRNYIKLRQINPAVKTEKCSQYVTYLLRDMEHISFDK